MTTMTTTTAPARATYAAGGQFLFGPRIEVHEAAAAAVSADEVCDLLAAAGPLTLRDIAGGLAVPARRAAGRIRQMLAGGTLKQDEFGRYRLGKAGV
jgi:hypothetical protein